MARVSQRRDPFEVRLSPEKEKDLLGFLIRELQYAEDARSLIVGDNAALDLTHERYLGGKHLTRQTPWPGAANLGSPVVTEKVDALRSRIVDTIFVDPIWIVEGYGASAERAPLVEAFHQWKAEASRLQAVLSRVIHNALIEGTGVLEVADRVVPRRGLRRINARVETDAMTGTVVIDPTTGGPTLLRNGDKFVEADAPDQPAVKTIVSDVVRATAGPSFRVHSLKHFFVLPGHASERSDIWGYAKRFYRLLPELQERERAGIYKNVEALGTQGDRDTSPADDRQGTSVPPNVDRTAEKEIWEVTLLHDLDEDGFDEWYVVTLSTLYQTILRVQYQDYNTPHYLLFTPFPRPTSVYGFAFGEDKLGSIYDEHAAFRNMFADRSALATSAPFLQLEGSPWNPARRPWGPRAVIPVRDIGELKQLDVKDVPNSVLQGMNLALQMGERLSGLNDLALGVQANEDRTLGENKIATEQSAVRINEIVKNCQEALEDLGNLLNTIWREKLEDDPEPLPGEILAAMEQRNISLAAGAVTAADLTGAFRFKPHGSVENADLSKMRNDFVQLLTALTQFAQVNPALGTVFTNPMFVKSLITQMARLYRWPDRETLIRAVMEAAQAMPTMPPGAPPGPPGAGLPPAQPPRQMPPRPSNPPPQGGIANAFRR